MRSEIEITRHWVEVKFEFWSEYRLSFTMQDKPYMLFLRQLRSGFRLQLVEMLKKDPNHSDNTWISLPFEEMPTSLKSAKEQSFLEVRRYFEEQQREKEENTNEDL